jgi:ABC-type bacteriocin/lantibiotic exporter with double-glycine peptidase domain
MDYPHLKKVPFIEQLQQTECGLCCMAMVVKYYKGNVSLYELRERMGNGRDGTTLLHLRNLASSLGFEAKCYATKVAQLETHLLPAILYWEDKHFVVLESIKGNHYFIVDPALGRRKITIQEMEDSFSGYLLSCIPDREIDYKKEKNIWIPYARKLWEKPKLVATIIGISILIQLLTVGMPILIKFIIDNIIMTKNVEILNVFLIGIILLVLFQTAFQFIQGRLLVGLQNFLDLQMVTRFFKHLLALPYQFFQVRSFGDLLFRAGSLRVVRDLLSGQLLKGVLDIGILLIIGIYMAFNSLVLTMFVFVFAGINMLVIYFSRPKIAEANQKEIMKHSAVQGTQAEILYGIFGIKTAGVEDVMYNKWSSQFNELITAYKKKEYILNNVNSITAFLTLASPLIVLYIGAQLVFSGNLTLGGLIAFHAITIQFFGLSSSVVNTINSFILATSYLKRVQDVQAAPIEEINEGLVELKDIKGDILLESVSFSYTKYSPSVVKNVNLHITSGSKVALVGKSGSGKSTLSKLILGLYQPSEGEVYFDGRSLKDLNKQVLRKQIGVVPQDVTLLNRSIFENIALHKSDATIDEVIEAAKMAQIHDEIMVMPMKYNTMVSEMGMNISGGQRQRIALARALVHKPSILLLDEATSSLDHLNEGRIDEFLENMNCTRVVIAHRLTTVMNADVILVMEDGQIVEQGTHSELLSLDGYYRSFYEKYDDMSYNKVTMATS